MENHFFRGQPRPPQMAWPQRFLIFFFRLCVHLLSQIFDVVTHVGEGRVFLGTATPRIIRKRRSRAAQYWGFFCIYTYIL